MNIIVRDETQAGSVLVRPARPQPLRDAAVPPTDTSAKVYQELADWYEQQRDGPMRDRFLLLAAASLLSSGHNDEAEKIRLRLLKLNPNHLLKPFPSLAEAVKSRDVREYIDGLRRNYSPPAASQLLESVRGPSGGSSRQSSRHLLQQVRHRNCRRLSPSSCRLPENALRIPRRKMKVRLRPVRNIPWKASRSPASAVCLARRPKAFVLRGVTDGWRPTSPTRRPAAWLSVVLFWATLIGGIALAGYLLGRVLTP